MNKAQKLLSKGMTEVEISKELSLPLVDVYVALSGETTSMSKIPPKIEVDEEVSKLEILKDKVQEAALNSIKKLNEMLVDVDDPDDAAKISTAIAKIHTAYFKEDTTIVNISNNTLNTFRDSLKL